MSIVVTPRIRRAYVPHFFNVTTLVVLVYDKQTRGVVLCYKYTTKQMITQGRGGRIIQ